MWTRREKRILGAVSVMVCGLTTFACGQSAVVAGAPQSRITTDNVREAENQLDKGHYSLANLETLALAKDSAVIPVLKSAFAKTDDAFTRAKIASTLIRLGSGDAVCWEVLEQSVELVLSDSEPIPFVYDAKGQVAPGSSPAFEVWARNHHMSLEDAGNRYFYDAPGFVAFLAQTEKTRSVSLLMQALSSTNPYVQINAALGLAQMNTKAAIPLIIEACESVPLELKSSMAEALIYFDDPKAAQAASRFIPEKQRADLEAGKARGNRPLR